MKLTIRPLTPDLWPALQDLFGKDGPCSRCWCMYWRIGSAYRERPREKNRAAFRQVVKRGPPPGLLAFDGDAALDAAKRAGAPALEAYPLDANLTPSTSHTGYASTFARAGFKIVARHVPPRPMWTLSRTAPKKMLSGFLPREKTNGRVG